MLKMCSFRRIIPLVGAALLALACAPAATTNPGITGEAAKPAAPKTLIMAVQDEATTVLLYGRLGEGGNTSARYERYQIFHANLTIYDQQSNVVAYAAEKVPSIENGDWKVSPDGTMEVTWHIRPDAYWHDGIPLAAEDFAFGFQVVTDKKLPVTGLGELLKISKVQAVDPHTLRVSWKEPSIYGNANAIEGIPAIPKHALEETYLNSEAPAFAASPAWRDEYIGLGPFKVTSLVIGSQIEAQAFDKFFLGRPKIDRLVYRWYPEPNVLVAAMLAGAVDVAPSASGFKPEQLVQLRSQWGPDGGDVYTAETDVRSMALNWRENGAWTRDVRFRQAMLQSMDRGQLTEDLQFGFVPIAEYFAGRQDPLYKLAEQRNVPKNLYDPASASRLFAEAGWTKGADGLLRNAGGETVPFPCCRRAADSNNEREAVAFGSYMKTAGLDVIYPVPGAPAGVSALETRKIQALGWGGLVSNFRPAIGENWADFISAQIPGDNNQWVGLNSIAWSNSTYDDLYTKAMGTLDPGQRQSIELQLLTIAANEIPMLPVYYTPNGVAVRKGVLNVGRGIVLNRGIIMGIQNWDLK